MPLALETISTLTGAPFDTIIDVRSPAEFAEDHLPGAVSMPVLSNEERARVGTIYVQESPFRARKIGAALVARNAAAHIESHLMGHDGGWRPLVYCWRGGQRSGSFAAILSQIGWRAETVAGGYRSWRRLVVQRLYDTPLGLRMIRLDGYTGTAKTALLHEVAAQGGQVIDLEGLANHRGSILGDIDGPQPAQKGFETALASALDRLDPARPVLVEAESARIGKLRLPPSLWVAMRDAPRIVVEAPVEARATFLAEAYAGFEERPEALLSRLDGLVPHVGRAVVDDWCDLLAHGRSVDLARSLVEHHYDPAYARLRRGDDSPVLHRIPTASLDPESLRSVAARILDMLAVA